MESMEDMQMQETGSRSVPLVVWTDMEDGSGSLSLPVSLIGHFQHLLVTPTLQVSFALRPSPSSWWSKDWFGGTDSPVQLLSF